MQDRSFCHQIDSSIEAIHHLASRSRSTQLRCSECELEQFSGYAFPPKFNLVPAVLNKVLTDQTEIVLVAQVSPPSDPVNSGAVLLPSRPHLLQNPADLQQVHPMNPPLHLAVFHVSSKVIEEKDFVKMLPTYSSQQLVPPHLRPTNLVGGVGAAGAI